MCSSRWVPVSLASLLTALAAVGCVSRIDDDARDAGSSAERDAGADAGRSDDEDSGVTRCDYDVDCSDHVWCNGVERCDPGSKDADARGCRDGSAPSCDDGIACTTDRCVENERACEWVPPDLDGDDDPDRRCTDAAGEALGRDCDDDDDRVNVFVTELCDDMDNDCDDRVDEGVSVEGYPDRDADEHGAVGSKLVTYCFGEAGFAPVADDCRDDLSNVHAAHPETCDDEQDNDCDQMVDEITCLEP